MYTQASTTHTGAYTTHTQTYKQDPHRSRDKEGELQAEGSCGGGEHRQSLVIQRRRGGCSGSEDIGAAGEKAQWRL